ncbi:MAG TPA: Hsp20 family protein [Asticcacaulis sp.]|nr:Hsp20 family protein [Asticcacaulis sp.]
MARGVIFDSPYLLGFDEMRLLIERVGRNHDAYPPYNVEALPSGRLRISIAVAGFTLDQLRVEVRGAHLTVSALRDKAESVERDYLHRGIALRGFNRAFVLSDGWQVTEAALAHGLLHIDLEKPELSDVAQTIPIKAVE